MIVVVVVVIIIIIIIIINDNINDNKRASLYLKSLKYDFKAIWACL